MGIVSPPLLTSQPGVECPSVGQRAEVSGDWQVPFSPHCCCLILAPSSSTSRRPFRRGGWEALGSWEATEPSETSTAARELLASAPGNVMAPRLLGAIH